MESHLNNEVITDLMYSEIFNSLISLYQIILHSFSVASMPTITLLLGTKLSVHCVTVAKRFQQLAAVNRTHHNLLKSSK